MSKTIIFLLVLVLVSTGFAQRLPDRSALASEVKTEFLHAWKGYKKYAWGNDDLKPLSRSFAGSLEEASSLRELDC